MVLVRGCYKMKLYFIYNEKEDTIMLDRNGHYIRGKESFVNTKRAMNYHIKESNRDTYKYRKNQNMKTEDWKIIEVYIK